MDHGTTPSAHRDCRHALTHFTVHDNCAAATDPQATAGVDQSARPGDAKVGLMFLTMSFAPLGLRQGLEEPAIWLNLTNWDLQS